LTLHTDIPTQSEIERLLTTRDASCVSIYLSTSTKTREAQADRIELKNLAAAASEQLEAAGADQRAVAEISDGLKDLVKDDAFWATQAHSLAVFASPARLQTFRLPNRLTSEVEVADRFYVKPLLRAVTFPQAAFVLALSAGAVRLVEVMREGAPFVVDVPDLPADVARGGQGVDCRSISELPVPRLRGPEDQAAPVRAGGRSGTARRARGSRVAADPRRHRADGVHISFLE
jgi:hypothetical protein